MKAFKMRFYWNDKLVSMDLIQHKSEAMDLKREWCGKPNRKAEIVPVVVSDRCFTTHCYSVAH